MTYTLINKLLIVFLAQTAHGTLNIEFQYYLFGMMLFR